MRHTLVLGVVLLSLCPLPLNSCGWDWRGEDTRFWLLQPELAEARELHPFYFTTEVFNGPDLDLIASLPYATNIAEWKTVVGNDVPDEDINTILYGTDPLAYLDHEAELIKSNAFLRKLAGLKDGWITYINFAKTAELLCVGDDPWGFEAKDVVAMRADLVIGQRLLERAKDQRLRARNAYQLVRLAYYSGPDASKVIDPQAIYEKHLAPLRGKTWLEPSAAFYLANMLPGIERDLAFAEIFDRATDKQFRMVQLFHSSEVDSYLPLAKSDRQRANLLVMRDLQHPGRALADLERIAAWDPDNRHLPLLLTREVNKLEDWLLTPALTDFNAAIYQWSGPPEGLTPEDVANADLNYLRAVQDFIRRIAPHAAADQRALLTVLDGHLSFVAGDLHACMETMSRVEAIAEAKPTMRMQARMTRILCGIMTSPKLTDQTRDDVLALVELVNTNTDRSTRSTMLGQLHLYLGKKLIERGEMTEGLFLLARSNRMYGTVDPIYYSKNARHVAFKQAVPADHDSMIALLDRPNKTPFEHYLTASDERPDGWENTEEYFRYTDLTREKLLDYKATWFVNEGRLEEAATAFKQIPDDFWTGYPYALFADDDPFVVNIEDPHNYEKGDSIRYNKRTIVDRIIALDREAAKNPGKRALNNYLLGNAYYNMSWHGKYWIMSRIAWSIWEDGEWRDRETTAPHDQDYFGCDRARAHYELAMEHAKDPVLKAMACRMAWECQKNRWAFEGQGGMDEAENQYLEQLKDEKSQEAYRAIEDCSGYADFVRRYR